MTRPLAATLAALLLLGLAACAPTTPPPPAGVARLSPASFRDLPGWDGDRVAEAIPAISRSCARIGRLPDDRMLGPPAYGRAGDWRTACAALPARPDEASARAFLEAEFRPLALSDAGQAEGLFTGYYEPLLRGSRRPGGAFRTPLLARPDDMVAVELGQFREAWRGERLVGRVVDGALRPYESRAEIEAGALAGRARPIAWVDDPVDAFFLQIQGSGRVALAEGGEMRVGYAAQNGHGYVPVGRILAERGEISREQVSMQSIRAWMARDARAAQDLMNANPSFVFFREISGEGPIGSEGVALVPGRSLAVDRSHVALGVPVWLDAQDPLDEARRVRRLLVAQDTGGAIRGVVRGDVFWGTGEEAAERAGRMRSRGRAWVLVPRDLAARAEGR
ncbi:MAG: murein transglycosylase A [Alphaproteobacteria bacterium]